MGPGWKLTLSFFLLFVIGGLCGSALTLVMQAQNPVAAAGQHPHAWEENMLNALKNNLKLSPQQVETARPKVFAAVRTMRRQGLSANNQSYDQLCDDLASSLNPDQVSRLQKMRERHRRRIEGDLERLNQSPSPGV